MADPMYHWKLMEQADPELNEKTKQWRSQICAHGAIPKKYVELMRVAMAAMARSVPTERLRTVPPRRRSSRCSPWS